jgi:putative tryptophan/tyrosine transport system substrate-binding protein
MNRRTFLAGTGAVLLAVPLAVAAQSTSKVYRIGVLSPGSATSPPIEAFRQGLRELGWIEGQNIVIDYRFTEGRIDRLPALAAELVGLKVDVIAAGPTPPAIAAKNATGTVPIVMMGAAEPVELGLIASLARPGGNVTGLSWSVNLEIIAKGLELLKETMPKIRLVAILWNPANPAQALAMRDVKRAARSVGVQLQLLEARGPNEFDAAFAAMAKQRAEALLVVPEAIFVVHGARLADLAARNRLPSMHGLRQNVDAGGLMSYGPSTVAVWRRAAFFVDKILKGVRPADLPVEQPTKYELVINLKTAKALGLTIPPSLLGRADEVIQR